MDGSSDTGTSSVTIDIHRYISYILYIKRIMQSTTRRKIFLARRKEVMSLRVMIINGTNGNMPENNTNAFLSAKAEELGISCEFFQGSSEGELVTLIQSAWDSADGVILNAGDYSHYSIAIRDAIASINKPVIELNLTNVYACEESRHTSMLSAVCKGVITGFGQDEYLLALHALAYEFTASKK